MKRYVSLLPFALIALALPGCVESKPVPQLASPNRHERIAAVRHAQNQYGARPAADRPVTAPDAAALVGRWNNPWTDAAYYQLNADGTAKRVTLLTSDDGTYRFLSDDALEFNFPDALAARHEQVSFRLRGDTLELYMAGAWVAYKKAKS